MTSQPSQLKEQRGTVNGRRRRQLLLLVVELQRLQGEFPTLREDIQSSIDDHLAAAKRTRAHDRRDVLRALEEWERTGSTIEDIATDTGLSLWTIRLVLDNLVNADPPLVGVQDIPKDRGPGRRGKVYRLLHAGCTNSN